MVVRPFEAGDDSEKVGQLLADLSEVDGFPPLGETNDTVRAQQQAHADIRVHVRKTHRLAPRPGEAGWSCYGKKARES